MAGFQTEVASVTGNAHYTGNTPSRSTVARRKRDFHHNLENLSRTANLQAFDIRVAVEIAKTKFKELQYLEKANNDGDVFVEVQN